MESSSSPDVDNDETTSEHLKPWEDRVRAQYFPPFFSYASVIVGKFCFSAFCFLSELAHQASPSLHINF